jgi:hypothetical protein
MTSLPRTDRNESSFHDSLFSNSKSQVIRRQRSTQYTDDYFDLDRRLPFGLTPISATRFGPRKFGDLEQDFARLNPSLRGIEFAQRDQDPLGIEQCDRAGGDRNGTQILRVQPSALGDGLNLAGVKY